MDDPYYSKVLVAKLEQVLTNMGLFFISNFDKGVARYPTNI